MSDSIFSRIIRGEVPANRVYEDDHVVAFMDIAPLSRGHVLVVPKEPAETMDQLSDESAAAVGRVLPRVCRAVMRVTGAEACNVLQNNGSAAGQAVFHVHVHIIPRYPERDPGQDAEAAGAGLTFDWRPVEIGEDDRAELGRKIARLL